MKKTRFKVLAIIMAVIIIAESAFALLMVKKYYSLRDKYVDLYTYTYREEETEPPTEAPTEPETSPNLVEKSVTYKFNGLVNTDDAPIYSSTGKYFTWTSSYIHADDKKDENGVVITLREEIDGISYHPVAIAQYGLDTFGSYIETGDEKYLNEAKAQADYLVDSIDPETGLLYYDFPFDVGGSGETLDTGWSSAMAQGQACSLMIRLYDATGNKKYYEACQLAMISLTVDVADGGLVRDFYGHPYYEEYPTKAGNYALNGFMFTLLGLYDVWDVTGDEMADKLYNEGMDTLKFALPFYDSNQISLYHLAHLNGTGLKTHYDTGYHKVHINQLKVFSQFEDDDIFPLFIDKWTRYVNN